MSIQKIILVLVYICAFDTFAIRLSDEQPSKVETVMEEVDSVLPAALQIPTKIHPSR